MYIRNGINYWHLLRDSWWFLLLVSAWSLTVVYFHEIRGITFIAIPMAPITIIGIAVSLYLGFKSTSAYNRWWEARTVWGQIVTNSRSWLFNAFDLTLAPDKALDPGTARELVDRHLAWVNALAHQLRASSRLRESRTTRLFGYRRVLEDVEYHQHPDNYRRYLSETEAEDAAESSNPALAILRRQSGRLKELALEGYLDSYRHVKLMGLIETAVGLQGACERIKNTPFPRQVANFGMAFTWTFILLLPLGLVDAFEAETKVHAMGGLLAHEYMFTMVPFTVLISWIFFAMEKVSDSVEDPFEGGVTDVPISALCRLIKIELGEMSGAEKVPEGLKPVDGVLY